MSRCKLPCKPPTLAITVAHASDRSLVQYFRELGCKVEVPTESERMKMKIIKAEAPVHRLAKLRLPLDFPKNRKIPLKRR